MEQEQSRQNGENQGEREEAQPQVWSITGTALSIQIFVIALFLLGLGVYGYLPPAERGKVFVDSMFNLAIVIVVIVHAVIYYKQTEAMNAQLAATKETLARERAQIDPRLRVSKVRMENFQVGLAPIFITTVANDGLIDATGVELHIGAKFGHDREFKWINPQIVTIPARGQESYPIVSGAFFSEEDLRAFNSNSAPIEVSVGLRYWPGSPNEPRRFCYRYLPWHGGERPDDIPQFVPCDFNPGLNITLQIPSGVMKHTAGIPVIRQQIKQAKTKGEQ